MSPTMNRITCSESFGRESLLHSLVALTVVCLLVGSSATVLAQATGQKDDPDALLVPEGLKRQLETPPKQEPSTGEEEEESPETPRTVLSDDAKETIVGKLISFRKGVLTIELEDGATRTFRLTENVAVWRNGERTSMANLQFQDPVRVTTSGDPQRAASIVAASPPPSTNQVPDMALRQRQLQKQLDDQSRRPMRAQSATAGGGRIWVLLADRGNELVQQGIHPGDVIIVVDRQMITSESVLNGITVNSGLFPMRTTANGQAALGAVSTTGGVGVVVPLTGTGNAPATGAPKSIFITGDGTQQQQQQQPVDDQDLGPPIGERPGGGDRNFGPPIGTGENPNPAPQQRLPPPAPPNPAGGGAQTPSTGGPTPSSAPAGEGAAGAGAATGDAASGTGN